MKKLLILPILFMAVLSCRAEIVERWFSVNGGSNAIIPDDGLDPNNWTEGADWKIEIYDVTLEYTLTQTSIISTYYGDPWYEFVGNTFAFQGWEGSTVKMIAYNNADAGLASQKIESASVVLQDGPDTGPWSPPDQEVTFDFSSSNWQAIPEPTALALLFGVSSGLLFIRRRFIR